MNAPQYPFYGISAVIAINMIMACAAGGTVAILIAAWAQVSCMCRGRDSGHPDSSVGTGQLRTLTMDGSNVANAASPVVLSFQRMLPPIFAYTLTILMMCR